MAKEVKSNRIIPEIVIDEGIYKEYGLKRHTYKESVQQMLKELKLLS